MLLREYAIKRLFVIPPLLTNVCALPEPPEEHEHELQKLCLFSHAVYRDSKMTLLWLAISSTRINQFFIFFVDTKVVLLSTVCKYYFLPSHFFRDMVCSMVCSMTEKTQFLRFTIIIIIIVIIRNL